MYVCLFRSLQTPKMNWRRGRKTFTASPPLRKCVILCRRMLVISLFVGCGLMFKAAIAGLKWSDGGKNLSSFYKDLTLVVCLSIWFFYRSDMVCVYECLENYVSNNNLGTDR